MENISPSAAIDPAEEIVSPSMTKLIRAWCERNNWLPDAKVLSHFTGLSVALFDLVRRAMAKEGWAFERLPDARGWQIIKPETADEKRLRELTEQAALIDAEIQTLRDTIRKQHWGSKGE